MNYKELINMDTEPLQEMQKVNRDCILWINTAESLTEYNQLRIDNGLEQVEISVSVSWKLSQQILRDTCKKNLERIEDVLRLREKKTHELAYVRDGDSGKVGSITLEDMIEYQEVKKDAVNQFRKGVLVSALTYCLSVSSKLSDNEFLITDENVYCNGQMFQSILIKMKGGDITRC